MCEKSCKPSPVVRAIITLLLVLCALYRARAQQNNSAFQFDPSATVNVDITDKVRMELLVGHEDSEDAAKNRWKVRTGLSFRLKPLFRSLLDGDPEHDKRHFLVFKASYEYSRSTYSEVTYNEHRITLEATPRHRWPGKILTSDRNRLEFRWINGLYHLRYRNRVRAERGFRIKNRTLTPYVSAEAYWDQRYNIWSQVKFTGGADIPLGRKMSLDTYYERRNCTTCSRRYINILGASLNLYFKLKH